jgi:hypothetical protein
MAATGKEQRAHIFVAALGASNFTYAEAGWTEGLAGWIGAHANTFAVLGGGPHVKPVGERNAGNPHVAFDEREEETERRLRKDAPATAPFLDSTNSTWPPARRPSVTEAIEHVLGGVLARPATPDAHPKLH